MFTEISLSGSNYCADLESVLQKKKTVKNMVVHYNASTAENALYFGKHCRSRSAGFLRVHLIKIHTIFQFDSKHKRRYCVDIISSPGPKALGELMG